MSDKPRVYVTNHIVSRTMCDYLAIGFDGQKVPASTGLIPGPLAIMYGILRGCAEVIKECDEIGNPYLYMDHSYFSHTRCEPGNRDYSGYFRLVKNGRYTHPTPDYPSDRFDALGIAVKPWRKPNNGHIVVCPLSLYVADLKGVSAEHWLKHTVRNLAQFTDRDIRIKQKDADQSLADALIGAHALVTLDSNAATDAAVLGVPVFTSFENAAAPIANMALNDIENPAMPDRRQWLANLAYQQWKIEEIDSGFAKSVLFGDN